mmetsp:Transcript_87896/g.223730  ORF Transcript_87896/g.223730 Transcript_87896/m.223730 type:complete len:360 (-) Transcript_87896:17-1096(-)
MLTNRFGSHLSPASKSMSCDVVVAPPDDPPAEPAVAGSRWGSAGGAPATAEGRPPAKISVMSLSRSSALGAKPGAAAEAGGSTGDAAGGSEVLHTAPMLPPPTAPSRRRCIACRACCRWISCMRLKLARAGASDRGGASAPQAAAEAEAEAVVLSEVTTFSDFVRHCPQLVKSLPSAPATDVVLLCRNMAQAKYFDGDLMAQVWRCLRAQIPLGQLMISDLSAVVSALKELNAYDQGVFRAAAMFLTPQVRMMSQEQRKYWIEIYREVKHQGDLEFAQALARNPADFLVDVAFDPGPCGGSARFERAAAPRHRANGPVVGEAARVRSVLCMLHGKQRSIDMMVDEGGGHYSCAPNRRCK